MTNWAAPGYTEIRQLGAGATGPVYLVRNEATGEFAVVKHPSANGGQVRRDLSVLAEVRNPHLVQIIEMLDSLDGRIVTVAMEAVEGTTARAMLSVRRLVPEAGLALLRGSLLGMAAVHERGLVHRDYKPDNVLVDCAGQCKLINVGIAAPADERDPLEGSAPYRAPELWRGATATQASDVYAAAVAFFECLTGTQPFSGTTEELRTLHESAELPLDYLPEPVRPLVERGTAKDPRDRYPDVQAFVADLDAAAESYGREWLEHGVRVLADAAEIAVGSQPLFGSDGPAAEGAAAMSKATRTWWKRGRTRLTAAAVVVLALVAVLIVVLNGGGTQTVREPFVQAIAALAKAPGVRYQDDEQFTGYFDATVTATGERFGSTGQTPNFSGKNDESFITVDGRDYMKNNNDPRNGSSLYDTGEDEKDVNPLLKSYTTPAQLAATLNKALSQQPRLPVVGDKAAASIAVNGIPAWKADTVDGYISQRAPYRVLRWEPPNTKSSEAALAQYSASPMPRSVEANTPLTDSLGMDITPVADATRLYDTVIRDTKDLASAEASTAVDIQQTNDSSSNVSCSSSGCRVNVAFSGPVTNSTSAQYALTTVYIDLTVGSITTGGVEVGGCTSSPQPYHLNDATLSGQLTCDNPQAGATYDEVNAQNQALANANGSNTFWDYARDINLNVYLFTSADINQMVAKEQHELQSLG